MLSILPIAYLAVLAGCAAAILLTAIIFLIKKKAGKSLALYAVCVLALLGLGFLTSAYNPVPNPRHTDPEPVVVSPGSQNPPTPWAITPEPDPVEPVPMETVPVDDADAPEPDSDLAPIAGEVEDVPESSAEPSAEKISTRKSSTARISSASASPQQGQPQSSEVQSTDADDVTPVSAVSMDTSVGQQSAFNLAGSLALTSDPVFTLDDNPPLAPEPTLDTMTNPAPLYDPPLGNQSESAGSRDSSQSAAASSAGNNSGTSGGNSSSTTYIHDFSNGRVLITTASDNNGDPVYHTRDCRVAKTIPPKNEDWYDSAQEAIAADRRLCKICAG